LNFSIADLAEGRGVILNNTWTLDNVYFISNKGGVSGSGGFNITCHNCTFQGNAAGGSLETGDVGDQIGDTVGKLSNTGTEPMNILYQNCHWEWNGNINQYIQYGQRIRTIAPMFASTNAVNGDWVIGPNASTDMVLEQPTWLSSGPHIVTMGGDYHHVDTAGSPVSVNRTAHSLIYYGNKILAGDYSHAYQLVGTPTADHQVALPDADSSAVAGGSKLATESCTQPAVSYDAEYAYFCTSPNHWKRFRSRPIEARWGSEAQSLEPSLD
jgi:hypothetical protein